MVTDSFDAIMRRGIASLQDRVAELQGQFEEARMYGDPAEVHRLRTHLDEARSRLGDAKGIAALGESASALSYEEGEGWHGLDRCQDALDDLLYSHGGDGMYFLEVVEESPTRITLVGDTYWLPSTKANLVEATFDFDQESRAINRVVVRAGVVVGNRRYSRPEIDEQWAVVIRVALRS